MSDPLSQLSAGPSPISLSSVFSVLRKRLWLIIGIVIAVPSLVGLYVSKQPKIYEASASLIIDSAVPQYMGPDFKNVMEIESGWWDSQETLQTELKVIHSYPTATEVARTLCTTPLGHTGQMAFKVLLPQGDCNSVEDIKTAALMVQGLVKAEPQPLTRVVSLSVQHTNPEFAALLANTIGQVYTERNLARRLSQSEGAATWLSEKDGDLTQKLEQSERALIDFKKKNNVVDVGIEDKQSTLSSQLRKLDDELNTVQVKLIAVRAQRDQYSSLKSVDPMEDVTPGVVDNPTLVKLKEMYLDQVHKLADLRGKYLDKHPLIVAQEARVEAAHADLAREAAMAAKSVEAQYAMLMREEKDFNTARDKATRDQLELDDRAVRYRKLKRDYDRLLKISEQVGGREGETSLAGQMKTNNVRPLDPALVPMAAIGPDVMRAVGAATAAALVLALGLAFLLELLDSTVKDQDDIEHKIGLSFLGLIPSINLAAKERSGTVPLPPGVADLVRSGSKDLFVLSHPKSAVAECCRAIRTNLLFMTPDNPARRLLVTSAGSQEGKTTTAVNLAITLAQSGLRVLLVDTDMRRPRLHKAFGIPATSDGLSRAILGETAVLDQVRETGVPNLSLLPCGATPPNPAELLHAERFHKIVGELSDAFDRVIFDSPPVGPVTDAAILARITDGTIIVAKFGSTSKDGLMRARRQLVDGGVNVLGCILNDLDLAHGQKYGYYAGRYGYYYSEDTDGPSKAEPSAS